MPDDDGNLAYRLSELERDVSRTGGLVDRLSKVEIAAAEARRDQMSIQRSLEATTTTLKWVLTAVAGTGLTVLGAVIAFALTGGSA